MAGHIVAAHSRVQNGAWWTLSSMLTLMLIAGTIYGFGAWSPALKEAYDLDQETLEMLASASHIGNYVLMDSGLLTARFGTSFGMALGCAYACCGYLFLYISIVFYPQQIPIGFLIGACALYGHGCGTIDNAVMTESLADFKEYKGYANGCIKAYYGLATATIATIYQALFRPNKSMFLLFLAVYSFVAGCTLIPVIYYTRGLVDESERKVTKKFRLLTAGIILFAIYFFMLQLFKEDISQTWWQVVFSTILAGMAALFMLPMGGWGTAVRPKAKIPPPFDLQPDSDDSGDSSTVSSSSSSSSSVGHERDYENSDLADSPEGSIASRVSLMAVETFAPRDVSGMQMLCYLDFWIFMVVCIVGQGCALMFLANASQILPAMAGHEMDQSQTAFLAGVSVFNSLARLGFGTISELLKTKVARSWFLVLASVMLWMGCLLSFLGDFRLLWPAAALLGFGYGGLWGVQPTMISELFGPSDFSFKYACSAAAAAIGSSIFNDFVAGPVYQEQAEARPEYPKCFDFACFKSTFLVCVVAGLPAIAMAVTLAVKTRWIYRLTSSATSTLTEDEDN